MEMRLSSGAGTTMYHYISEPTTRFLEEEETFYEQKISFKGDSDGRDVSSSSKNLVVGSDM